MRFPGKKKEEEKPALIKDLFFHIGTYTNFYSFERSLK